MLKPKINEIKNRREEKMMSQHQLSLSAGLNGCAINRIENSVTSRTHPLRAREIARVLGCDVSDIFEEARKG